MIFAMYVCDATNATQVAAIKMTVTKIGPTTLSSWPRGTSRFLLKWEWLKS